MVEAASSSGSSSRTLRVSPSEAPEELMASHVDARPQEPRLSRDSARWMDPSRLSAESQLPELPKLTSAGLASLGGDGESPGKLFR